MTLHALRLGDVLVRLGAATRERVESGLDVARRRGRRLGEALVEDGHVTERDLFRALAIQRGLAFATATDLAARATPQLERTVSRVFLERHGALPLRRDGDRIVVACCDPDADLDDLGKALGAPLEIHLVTPTDYRRLWGMLEGGPSEPPRPRPVLTPDVDLLARHDADARFVRLLETVMLEAIGERASDVHLERYGETVRIRVRVDGDLRDVAAQWSVEDLTGVVNVVKIAAGLDIAERRLPQGGRFRRRAGSHTYDLRVQTQPALHGEHL